MIRFIEELSMNAWPSLQTYLYDGWVIRFAGGYTKRANSVNPVYVSTEDISRKIEQCEILFGERQLKSTYKITPVVFPESLDQILEKKGYLAIGHTSLRILELNKTDEVTPSMMIVNNEVNEKWLENCGRLNGITEKNLLTLQSMLQNILPQKYLVSLMVDDKVIACGLGVIEGEYIGLFDIVVDAGYRRQGYGEELVRGLLTIGKANGARFGYLQVVENNSPALKLYEKIGFKELYRYWYRVKEESVTFD